MGKKLNIAAALLAGGALTMCASVPQDRDAANQKLSTSQPSKGNTVAAELADLGISSGEDGANTDWENVLSVEQVSAENISRDYAFAEVKGIHPCQREDVVTDDCLELSAELAEQLAKSKDAGELSTLSGLQALTPDVVDPQSFDPAATANELGRSPLPKSQAAQSLGFQLLSPAPVPVEPEPEDTLDPTLGDLPPIPVIVNGN